MSVVITRLPKHVHRQRYRWKHEGVYGQLHAGEGYAHTFIGAWMQSVRQRFGRRLHLWRLAIFPGKSWRMP